MPHDHIAFPVAWDDTISYFFRAFFDTYEVLDGLVIRAALSVSTAAFMPAAEAFKHNYTQLASRPDIEI